MAIVIEEKPLEERLSPETSLHQKILARLIARRDLSKRHIDTRADQWRETNDRIRMYIDLTKSAKKADGTRDFTKKEMPFERSIVVPVSYSIMQVLLTQLMAIFGSREPMLEFSGRSPEDVKKARLMESMIAYDLRQTSAFQSVYTLCQDAQKFGVGIIYDTWATEYGITTVNKPLPPGPEGDILYAIMGESAMQSREHGVIREYNQWSPVDPFDYYPDPKVPIASVEDGEWVGHAFRRGHMYLLERSQKNGGVYFNVDKISGSGAASFSNSERGAIGIDQVKNDTADSEDRGVYDIHHLQCKIIPREWELSESENPEIWWFTWVDDEVIVRAHVNPYDHGQYTYAVAETAPDFHSAFNPGIVESLDGLQRVIDWLFNSHIENLRKHLNDAMIFAPAFVEQDDLTNPGPGRHIRLTELGEELLMGGGYSIDNFVHQLQQRDVTSPHLNAVETMFGFAQRLSAANDPLMGIQTEDRKTLGEINIINASASQRISIIARLIDSMAIRKLADHAVANRQQFTSLEQYYKIIGDDAPQGSEMVLLDKASIAGNYDYVHSSGILPTDPSKQAAVWMQIAEMVMRGGGQPDADGRVPDINKIFKEGFRHMGVKNINDFYVTPPPPPQVLPDEQISQQVQAGNMIPA